ncbi:uncharacterized protein [Rutidosis leptorrhynchoides]|uniref:uncharacterized protein n=1 Tax=Rutidosis leptorrhynchoides TaxID=125765 RepID=UPI003A9A5945
MHGSDLTWPSTWYTEFNAIQDVAPPILTDQSDIVQWRDCSGNWIDFPVSVVWDTIRPHAPTIPWCSVIWYNQCIPRHAFIVWLLMGERLKTQDKLKFTHVVAVANWSSDWKNLREILIPYANCNVARGVVAKLFFGALVYYVWQERNNRLYGQKARSVDQLYEVIFSTVRMKLLSIKFRNFAFVRVMKECWKVP